MSDLWATPQVLFDKLHEEFDFVLDVCALDSNNKCSWFFDPTTDGLAMQWWSGHEKR